MILFKKQYWKLKHYSNTPVVYAQCNCGYEYNCSGINKKPHFRIVFTKLHPFCPQCGKKHYTDSYVADQNYFGS